MKRVFVTGMGFRFGLNGDFLFDFAQVNDKDENKD